MRYLDPYELFSIADPAQVDEDLLRKLRRRMMAEFELSNDGFLDWRGQAVDKTAATECLDAMGDAQTREHYWAMRRVPGLVAYLASDDPQLINQVQFEKLLSQPALHFFISAFWASHFEQQLGKALDAAQWPDAMKLLRYTKYLHSDHLDEAFRSAVRKAQVAIIALENAALTALPALLEFDVTPYAQQGFVNAFNQYPPRFQYLRDAYGKALLAYARLSEKDPSLLPNAMQAITAACDLGQDYAQRNLCIRYRQKLRFGSDWTRRNQPRSDAFRANSKANESTRKLPKVLAIVGGIVVLVVYLMTDPQASEFFRDLFTTQEKTASDDIQTIDAVAPYNEPPIYEALRSQTIGYTGSKGKKPKAQHETGWIPYPQLFNPLAHKPKNGEIAEFTFENQSKKDLVVFLETPDELPTIAACYYVKAYSKLDNQEIAAGTYMVKIFNGEEWRDAIGTFQEQALGGFTQNVEFIGNYKTPSALDYTAPPNLEVGIRRGHLFPTVILYYLYELTVESQ